MKKIISLLLAATLAAPLLKAEEEEPDYTKGVFILNEDWFGHQNSTINYLTPSGEWEYRVFQKENPGKELGCTSQYGAIFDGRMYIISKQEKDKGATVTGGRITVCDAKTMKCLKQIEVIATGAAGESVADGRAFVGITPEKGYVSTSNGIYLLDLDKIEVGPMIEGTGNRTTSLYRDQCGTMLYDGSHYVYALHQTFGLLVIDVQTDRVVKTVAPPVEMESVRVKRDGVWVEVDSLMKRSFGSIVQSKDGDFWISVAKDTTDAGISMNYIYRFDPLEQDTVERVPLSPDAKIPNSWYAWTADGFCASSQENKLYWKDDAGWFNATKIYCYDIDRDSIYEFFNTADIGWNIYGAGFRLHPETDELYLMLFQEFVRQDYLTVRLDNRGNILGQYEMIENYWFPALPIFPEGGGLFTGIGSVSDDNSNAVWPNPVVSTFYITADDDALMSVYDVSGRLLLSQWLSRGENTVDASSLTPGIYIVRCGNDTYRVIKR